jgi:hypothetical protein
MTQTLNRFQHRFADEVPAMGNLYEGMAVAASGYLVVTGLTYYALVPYTNVVTSGVNQSLRPQPGPRTTASARPVFEVHEIRLPSIEDFVPEWLKELNIASEPTKEDRAWRHVPNFLNEVYSLAQVGDTDTAGFKIYDFLDRVLIDGFFAVCDDVLSKVDVERLDTRLMDSFLTITYPAKSKLPSRAVLYKKIEAKMIALKGRERTRRIIGPLA